MNTQTTWFHKLFVGFMTVAMVLGMCPTAAFADALLADGEAEPLANGEVVIEDGEASYVSSDQAEAAAGDDAAGPAEEPSSEADGAEGEGGFTMSTVGAMADSSENPANLTISGTKDKDWSYDSREKIVTIKTSRPITVSRPGLWGTCDVTLRIDSKDGANVTLQNVYLDGRTLNEEEAKKLIFIEDPEEEGQAQVEPRRSLQAGD